MATLLKGAGSICLSFITDPAPFSNVAKSLCTPGHQCLTGAEVVAGHRQVLGCSVSTLDCKSKLLQQLYTRADLFEIIAPFPDLPSYSLQRLKNRLSMIHKTGHLSRTTTFMICTDASFAQYIKRHSNTSQGKMVAVSECMSCLADVLQGSFASAQG